MECQLLLKFPLIFDVVKDKNELSKYKASDLDIPCVEFLCLRCVLFHLFSSQFEACTKLFSTLI